jgi:pimeloyl-ACP methyl ester carboxylesterase
VPLVEALADHLGHAQFVTMGWSGGGPHAIATAALLPQRCAGAMSLAGVAPYGEPDLDFLAGMGEDNIAEFGAALEGDSSLEAFLSGAAGAMRDVTADQVIDAMRSLLPAVDQAHLTGQEAEEMAAELRWSLAHGIWGWFDDDIAFTRPWGFDLGTITAPVQVWQGTDDLMVPFAHGQWLVQRLSSAEPRLVEGEGHLSLAARACQQGFADLRRLLDR